MEEEEPELDISQMLPEPSGFMAFAGSGNRCGKSYICICQELNKYPVIFRFESGMSILKRK